MKGRHHRGKKERDRGLYRKGQDKVMPESCTAEVPKEIREVIRIAIPINGSEVRKIPPGRYRKHIRRFDHQQRRCTCNDQPLALNEPLTALIRCGKYPP